MSRDMMYGGGTSNAIWAIGGAIVGWWAGRNTGPCGGYGYGHGYGYGYAGNCGPVAPGCDPFVEKRLANLEAGVAANAVAIQKDEKIAFLEDKVMEERLEGKIFKATCMKPNGQVFLSPNHLANAYRGESRVLDSHQAFPTCENGWY